MMHPTDATYLVLVSLAGAAARALRRGLPPGWRLRLEASAPSDLSPGWIWLHAVSVGELLLAESLTAKLLDAGHRVHITTGTSAGLDLLHQRIPLWDRGRGRLSGGAFPLDDPSGLRSFFKVPPSLFIALETELWPNLLRRLEDGGIPRIIVNGRLTVRTAERGGPWLSRAAARLSLVAARDPASMAAFLRMGAPRVQLGGNLKSDLPPPRPLEGQWAALRRGWHEDQILVAGSTLEGEEALVLGIWKELRTIHPSLRLILAPRQPRRFEVVAAWLESEGLVFRRASKTWPDDPGTWRETEVLLLDTLGDLPSVYGEGTVALVGGGWCGAGGHNPLEPIRWGIPTLVGPGYENFQDLVEPLQAIGVLQIIDKNELVNCLRDLLKTTPLRGHGPERTPILPDGLTGSSEKTWRLIEPFLPTPG